VKEGGEDDRYSQKTLLRPEWPGKEIFIIGRERKEEKRISLKKKGDILRSSSILIYFNGRRSGRRRVRVEFRVICTVWHSVKKKRTSTGRRKKG